MRSNGPSSLPATNAKRLRKGAKRRINPYRRRGTMDCFASLAMTRRKRSFVDVDRARRAIRPLLLPLLSTRALGAVAAGGDSAARILTAISPSSNGSWTRSRARIADRRCGKRASAGLTSMRHEHACAAAASAQSGTPAAKLRRTTEFRRARAEHLRDSDANPATKMRLRAD